MCRRRHPALTRKACRHRSLKRCVSFLNVRIPDGMIYDNKLQLSGHVQVSKVYGVEGPWLWPLAGTTKVRDAYQAALLREGGDSRPGTSRSHPATSLTSPRLEPEVFLPHTVPKKSLSVCAFVRAFHPRKLVAIPTPLRPACQ